MKVRNYYDNEGHTEQEVLPEKEVTAIVQTWDNENCVADTLIEAGIFQTGQTNGITKEVRIDTRDGEISLHTSFPNQYGASDSFFITLATVREMDFNENAMVEGGDMTATLTKDEIIGLLTTPENFEDLTLIANGEKFDISWDDNQENIECETFIRKALKEDYDEWVNTYESWLMENVRIDYDKITEFYK